MSYADKVFVKNCIDIIYGGGSDFDSEVRPRWEDGTPAHTLRYFGIVNRYDLSQEFPIMTLRRQYLKSAIKELLWIWQKKSNNIHDLDSSVWDEWADSDGSIGKAYGYQLRRKYKYPEGMSDQVDHVLYELKNNPMSRRMVVNMFIPEDLHEMNLAPCAHSVTFEVIGNRLNLLLNQRSQDMITANGWNVMQYAALDMMFAKACGLEPGILVHAIADAHIYDRHIKLFDKMCSTHQTYPAPKVTFEPSSNDFYSFSADDFKIENYRYNNFTDKIEVAI